MSGDLSPWAVVNKHRNCSDPVGAGLVESLSRPGGNTTGFSTFEPEIGGKWVETLAEAVPTIKRVGIVFDPNYTGFAKLTQAIEATAPCRNGRSTTRRRAAPRSRP
jgi:ABC-type uncharacterized transport system substrate-binding protein